MKDLVTYHQSADASSAYYEQSGVVVARLDSASQCGNLADITQNSTVLLGPAQNVADLTPIPPSPSLVEEHEILVIVR